MAGSDDSSSCSIQLNLSYDSTNLPVFFLTGYIYTGSYVNVQRQFGMSLTGSPQVGANVVSNIGVSSPPYTITITNLITGFAFFPATANDASGYALYIIFQILN